MIKFLSTSIRGELTTSKPKAQYRVAKFNFVDELINYVSQRSGEEMEFTKKGILNLLESEICVVKCKNLMEKVAKLSNSFKLNSHSKHSFLHFLCRNNETDIIKLLFDLETPIDFNILDLENQNPPFIALKNGHIELTEYLFMKNFKPLGPKHQIMNVYHKYL